jgi:hypothetical protein
VAKNKIKQSKVSIMGGLAAIVGARPMTQAQCTDLNLHNRLAFESLLSGGKLRDFEVIAALSNLVQIIDDKYFLSRKGAEISSAQAEIKSAYEISKKRGTYLLTAGAIREIKSLLALHEAQLQQITQGEMRKAVEYAQRLEREAYREMAE